MQEYLSFYYSFISMVVAITRAKDKLENSKGQPVVNRFVPQHYLPHSL